MSDKPKEDKKGFFASIPDFFKKIDESLHEKPISRIEDLFALIGLGTVINRNHTFFGAFLLILSYLLRGGVAIWGWSEKQIEEVRAMLSQWEPFTPCDKDDSIFVMAMRRLFDFQHLYRWLIILGGIGVLISLSIWLIVIAGWIGFAMYSAVLAIILGWSVMSRIIKIMIWPIAILFVVGAIILCLSYMPNAQPWLMVFAILTVIASMAMLAVVFWPISIVARWFSSGEQSVENAVVSADSATSAENANVDKSVKDKVKKDKKEKSKTLGKYIADCIVMLCWPVSLMVSALMFQVWADPISQLSYISIIVVVLSLSLFGIRKEWIRKALNSAAVGNLFLYPILIAYGWFMPVDIQAGAKYQTMSYGYSILGVYCFRTDAKYYWDVNNNCAPDSIDLRFLQDGLRDSTVFPNADRRFGDINGDGLTNSSDITYFQRFKQGIGPKPVKAVWFGTPKPSVLAKTVQSMKQSGLPTPEQTQTSSANQPAGGQTNQQNSVTRVSEQNPNSQGVSSLTVTVLASQSWTYVCQLTKGQRFKIKASGQWDCSGGGAVVKDLPCTGSGLEAPNWIPDREISYFPYQSGRVICNLIGKLDGHVFNIGDEFEGNAEDSGVLYAGPNDYDVRDNDGSLLLTVSIDN